MMGEVRRWVPSCLILFKCGFGFWQNPGSKLFPTWFPLWSITFYMFQIYSDIFRCIHIMKDLMITLYSDNLGDTIIYHDFINHYYSDDGIPKIWCIHILPNWGDNITVTQAIELSGSQGLPGAPRGSQGVPGGPRGSRAGRQTRWFLFYHVLPRV